jgi:hypothetical protein
MGINFEELIPSESNDKLIAAVKEDGAGNGYYIEEMEKLKIESSKKDRNHKTLIFYVVLYMAIITYVMVMSIILLEVVEEFHFHCLSWFWFKLSPIFTITPHVVNSTKLGIIITGFVAEMFFLQRIILKGLFK